MSDLGVFTQETGPRDLGEDPDEKTNKQGRENL